MAMNLLAPLQRRRDAEELIDMRLRSRQALARDIVNLFKPGAFKMFRIDNMKIKRDLTRIRHGEGFRSHSVALPSTHHPP